MSNTQHRVKHLGTITKITADLITVNIVNASACSNCHSKNYCSLSDKKNKLITIKVSHDNNSCKIGDTVSVVMALSIGFKAIIIGYIVPFFVLLIALLTSFIITKNEVVSGLISIFLLVPYYFVVYLLRNRITKNFEFSIESL